MKKLITLFAITLVTFSFSFQANAAELGGPCNNVNVCDEYMRCKYYSSTISLCVNTYASGKLGGACDPLYESSDCVAGTMCVLEDGRSTSRCLYQIGTNEGTIDYDEYLWSVLSGSTITENDTYTEYSDNNTVISIPFSYMSIGENPDISFVACWSGGNCYQLHYDDGKLERRLPGLEGRNVAIEAIWNNERKNIGSVVVPGISAPKIEEVLDANKEVIYVSVYGSIIVNIKFSTDTLDSVKNLKARLQTGYESVDMIFHKEVGFMATMTTEELYGKEYSLYLTTSDSSKEFKIYSFTKDEPVEPSMNAPDMVAATSYGPFVSVPELGQSEPETQCNDGIDNDGDGAVDCLDSDCSESSFCAQDDPEDEVCNDGIDNDGDGATDCVDIDCSNDVFCVVDDNDVDGNTVDSSSPLLVSGTDENSGYDGAGDDDNGDGVGACNLGAGSNPTVLIMIAMFAIPAIVRRRNK